MAKYGEAGLVQANDRGIMRTSVRPPVCARTRASRKVARSAAGALRSPDPVQRSVELIYDRGQVVGR
jgi:hypothetical protein